MSGLSDNTGALKNRYKVYIQALQDAGATVILDAQHGVIIAGIRGKNFVFDVDRKLLNWNGHLYDANTPQDCIKIISEL